MAISYVSEVVKGNSFIQPFSLELMSKVNSYKQSVFYQNASKLENEISGLANADILNPLQKQRAQELTNNLTTQINNMSSLDYSDMNVSNTLQGMAGSVSRDEQVLKGISSTKRIRELQGNIEKLKTDPKLNKYYAAQNEEYALRPVQAYIKGGALATFDGDTAPTPYKGNPFTRMQEAVKKLMPDIEVNFSATNNPFFVEKSTRKAVEPDKVYAAISGSVDGDMLKQIQIDSWYNTKNFTPEQTLQAYTSNYQNKLGSLTGLKDYYQKRIDTELIPSVKAEYERELADVNNKAKQLTTAYHPKEITKQLQTTEGQEAVNYNIYSSRLFDDVVKAGSYKQMDKSLIQDPAAMWQAKKELELYKAQLKAQYSGTGKKKNADGSETPIGNLGNLAYNTETAEQAASHKVTLNTYKDRNDIYEKNINTDIYKFLDNEISLNPEYAAIFPETTIVNDNPNAGPTEQVRLVLDKLRKMDNNPNLSVQDIRLAIDKNNKMGLNVKQIEFFKNVVNVIDKAATGKLNEVDFEAIKINKKAAVDVANSVNVKQQAITANKQYIEKVTNSVLQPIPQQYKATYLEYLKDLQAKKFGIATIKGDDFTTEYVNELTPLGKTMLAFKEKFNITNQSIEKILNNDENRPNYFGMNFNQKGLEEAKIDIGTNIASSNNTKRPSDLGDQKDITPTDVRRDETTGKWIINYSYKDAKNGKIKYSNSSTAYEVPGALASQLGLQDVPLPELESYMRYNKVSTPFYSYNNNLPGTKGVFKYDIGRVGDNRNPEGFVLRFYDDKGQVVQVKNGYGQQPFLTANQAKTFADTITNQQTFADAFQNSRENFFTTVNKIAYQ